MHKLEPTINNYFENRDNGDINPTNTELRQHINDILTEIESGTIKVAEKKSGAWQINQWVKKAILLSFRVFENQNISGGYTNFYDKVALQNNFEDKNIRVVPPATIRRGAYIGPSTVLMPSYVNIGAFIDSGCMIDTWATVGSCANIGKNVHISGGAGIGGVLEPLQANPVIIEDNCFIGARSEIVEGVIVEENSVISMGVYLGQSTKIYDREKDEIFYGRVPKGSVVIPGSLPAKNGKYSTNAAIIVKTVDAQTRAKVAINELLRD